MAKKMGMLPKAGTAGAMMVAAPLVGYGVGQGTDLDPGWRRAAVAGGATAVIAGGLAIFQASRPLALWAAIGGGLGSLALLAEPWVRKFWAERKNKKAAAPANGNGKQTQQYMPPPQQQPTYQMPQVQQQPIVIQQPAKVPTPTTLQQLTPVFTEVIKQIGGVVGGYVTAGPAGSTGTFGPLGSNGTFGPLGSMGMYVPAMAAAAA